MFAPLTRSAANFWAADSVKALVTKNVWVTRTLMPMPAKMPNALLYGALDALILKTLARGPRHGYAVARFIEDTSGDAVLVEEGSLYPALYRLERRGWVDAEWGTSELGRRAKLYRLTDAGRDQLAAEMATWRRFSAGVSKVLLST
jgi:PadR family transcriptional regulator, regulatory protein PadR